MKYLEFIIFIILILLLWYVWHNIRHWLRRKFYFSVLSRFFQRMQNKYEDRRYFSSVLLMAAADVLAQYPTRKIRPLLIEFTDEKPDHLYRFLKEKGNQTAFLILSAHCNQNEAVALIKTMPTDKLQLLLLGMLCAINGDYPRLGNVLSKLKKRILTRELKAYERLLRSVFDISNGDLAPASLNLEKAMSFFHKKHWLAEEAESCQIASEMYYLCGYTDQAFMMLEAAASIYKKIENKVKIAQTQLGKGLLMAESGRFPEAGEFLNDSMRVYKKLCFCAEEANVLIHKAKIFCTRHQYSLASKTLEKALALAKKSNSENALAFCYQVSAEIALNKKDFKVAKCMLEKSKKIYLKLNNYANLAEVRFVQKEIAKHQKQIKNQTLKQK